MDIENDIAPAMVLDSTASSGNPAGNAARAELTAIMNDPKHEQYEAYRRRDPAVNRYLDDLYRRAYAAPAPHNTERQPPSEPSSLSEDERWASEDAHDLEQLRADWERDGGYENGLKQANEMAAVLYTADRELYLEASRRLGDALGLKLLRMLRQRVNL